ncbi:MAG: DUF4111 domain-containing protein [Cellulosilyticum sp.]|nr:DUF4111 domain-containing protein [Cellulosilyticum sp.]
MCYQELLNNFLSISKETIGKQLTGIYLHGSMAMGCFNSEKSDIDLIVVINDTITDTQKLNFMEQVVRLNEYAPSKGLEISIVKQENCKPFVYPTPFELHFSPMHLQWFKDNPDHYVKNMKGEDKDLAAHFTIINRYGIVLFGEAIPNVFGEVSKKDYIDSISLDVENAIEDITDEPIYIILNLCRVLAFLKNDLCISKEKGGEWGLEHISKKYHSLILQALNCYKTNHIMQLDENLAKDFADNMLKEIQHEMNH